MVHQVSDHIIIVDDMPYIAQIIATRLHSAGFENITVYEDPREALEVVKNNIRPAIVITDFNMPCLTGVELLAEIDKHHPEIDGVIVTGNPDEAMDQAHRYIVISKATNFYNDLVKHVLSIMCGHLWPLIDRCPAGKEKDDCPFKNSRQRDFCSKEEWIDSLKPADISHIVRHHLACMEDTLGKS